MYVYNEDAVKGNVYVLKATREGKVLPDYAVTILSISRVKQSICDNVQSQHPAMFSACRTQYYID